MGLAARVLGYEEIVKWPFCEAPMRTAVLVDEIKKQTVGSSTELQLIRKFTVPRSAYAKVKISRTWATTVDISSL